MSSYVILNTYYSSLLLNTGLPAFNGSLFWGNGVLKLVARESNYTFINENMTCRPWPLKQRTFTNEVIYNVDFSTGKCIRTSYLSYHQNNTEYKNLGYEDIRLMQWPDGLHATFSNVKLLRHNSSNPNRPEKIPISHAIISNETLRDICTIYTDEKTEKNWQPIETMPGYYVYSYNPFALIHIPDGKITVMPGNNCLHTYCGSTPVIKYNGGNLCIVHTRNENKQYIHYMIQFDDKLNIRRISNPFIFAGAIIEFCTYMGIFGDYLYIVFSVYDNLSYLMSIPLSDIDLILSNKLAALPLIYNCHDMFYHDSNTMGLVKNAIAMATFSHNKYILANAIKENYRCTNLHGLESAAIVQDILLARFYNSTQTKR